MSELPTRLKFTVAADDGDLGGRSLHRVGVVDGVIGGPDRVASLAALFPSVAFESAGPAWPEHLARPLDLLIVPVRATLAADVEAAVRRLKAAPAGLRTVVVLQEADVMTTRRLVREGAADVLPAPVSEPALAICLERLLSVESAPAVGERDRSEVVAFLKAGGGVGATSLAAQAVALLADRGVGQVCLADLDLQFGTAALYLDLPEAISLADCLGAGAALDETPFGSALATHRSGARVLAAPRELMPLEALGVTEAEALVAGLRRDFDMVVIDLPSVWTAWTNRILGLADRIVLVTQLSVPHVHLAKRQLRMIAAQQLQSRPLTLVCNGLTRDQQAQLSIKAAEKALSRSFDVVVPEDARVMSAAINQGVAISAVRRGTKLEKAIEGLVAQITPAALAHQARRARW